MPTTLNLTRGFNDCITGESKASVSSIGSEKKDGYASLPNHSRSTPAGSSRRHQSRVVLALCLATGILSGQAYAQNRTIANLTTPPNRTVANGTLTVTSTYTNGGTTTVNKGGELQLGEKFGGTVNNTGTITLNTGGAFKLGVNVSQTVISPKQITLTGAGTLTLAGGTLTGVVSKDRNGFPIAMTSLINSDNSINGSGAIRNVSLTNQATINANVPGSTLTISNFRIGPAKVAEKEAPNSGTLEATNGGILTLSGPANGLDQITNQPNGLGKGGSIVAGAGSTVNLSQVSVTGGFLDSEGNGVINGSGDAVLVNLTMNANYGVGAGTTTSTRGQVRNNGTISVPGRGTLNVSGRLQNNGTVSVANMGALKGSKLINGNKVDAAVGSTVALSDFTQTGGTTLADGSIIAPQIDIRGGLLTGSGSLTGTVAMAGTLAPGDSGPGIISVAGQYDQTAAGILDEQLGGTGIFEFDQTLISGFSILDGLLDVSLVNGFVPTTSDVFPILEASDGFSGFFSDAIPSAPGLPGLLHYSGGTFDVNYNVLFDGSPAVTLSNFTPARTPEPASLLLLGSGLLGLGTILRAESARKRGGDASPHQLD